MQNKLNNKSGTTVSSFPIHSSAGNAQPTKEQYKAARKAVDDWFTSDEGELIAPAKDHGEGYSTSAKRRTVDSRGVVTIRYTFTTPDSVQRHLEYGDGCHAAVDHDHCGCKKCDSLYGPWNGYHIYPFINK